MIGRWLATRNTQVSSTKADHIYAPKPNRFILRVKPGTIAHSYTGRVPIITTSGGGGGSLVHGLSYTIIASVGQGTKSPAAPLIWDNCSAGAYPSDTFWTNQYSGAESPTYRTRYTTPAALGRGVALPHNRITRYIAGGHGGAGDSIVGFWAPFGPFPTPLYVSYYRRADPNWVYGGDNNYKDFSLNVSDYYFYGLRGGWYAAFVSNPGSAGSTGGIWSLNDDESFTVLDGGQIYQGFSANYNGPWRKFEIKMLITSASNGYIHLKEDNSGNIINYNNHKTENYSTNPMYMAIGGYARMYGTPNNWRYWCDVYMDTTLKRLVLTNNAIYNNSTIIEPQVPEEWDASHFKFKANLGKLSPGTAHLWCFTSASDDALAPTYVQAVTVT